jgi:DivIVA domain-containing protein
MSDDLYARIQSARFTPTRLRQGYDMAAVDSLLDRVCEALADGRPVEPVVAAARFPVVKMREGYDIREVDDFLAGLSGSTVPGPGTPASAATPATTTPATTTPSSLPSAVQEVGGGGFLKRLFGSRQS